MGDRIIYKFALRSLNILPVPSVPTIFPRIDESIGSKMVAKSATRSRSITPENSLRSRARTSDRSAKSQVFGPPPPTPSRIYGRKSKARSYMNTPSRLRRPPAASTSNTPSHYSRSLAEQSLALDYEFPVLLPETPSGSSASSSSDLTSIASSSSSSNSSNSNRVSRLHSLFYKCLLLASHRSKNPRWTWILILILMTNRCSFREWVTAFYVNILTLTYFVAIDYANPIVGFLRG